MIYDNEPNANEIIENLWLGNHYASQDKEFIEKYNIKIIINCAKDFPNYFENSDIIYYNLQIKDDINGAQIIEKNINQINYLINTALENKNGILIHCKAGHTRSANIVALYLYHKNFYSHIDSVNFVRSIRAYSLKKKSKILNYFLLKYN